MNKALMEVLCLKLCTVFPDCVSHANLPFSPVSSSTSYSNRSELRSARSKTLILKCLIFKLTRSTRKRANARRMIFKHFRSNLDVLLNSADVKSAIVVFVFNNTHVANMGAVNLQ